MSSVSQRDSDYPPSDSHQHLDDSVDEERKGLLSGQPLLPGPSKSKTRDLEEAPDRSWVKYLIYCAGVAIFGAAVYGTYLYDTRNDARERAKAMHFEGATLRSNGTHDFKRTVLIVSIDGLRADYLDRGLTPHLLDISKQGLRAKFMRPIFPTLTFPNHWALMTGLYAESHGIVANNFWDAETDSEFHYNKEAICWEPHWWFGEPMWETAGKAGVINANLMWPGPPKTSSGAAPTYFVPWRDKVPLSEKLDQITSWIDLPLEERPQLIMAYEPSLDQAGHRAGPYSALVNETLSKVDVFAKDLQDALVARNLTDIVDIVFVSDHGMTDTSHPELVYIDELLGEEGWAAVQHEDGWPSMGLHFRPGANVTRYLDILTEAAGDNEKFEVHTPETMPERYHFAYSSRIAPVYVIPKMGYVLTTKKEGDVGLSKGNHGYDNADPSMYAMFVAHGPFSAVAKAIHQSRAASPVRRALLRPNKGWHSTADDTYVMDGFQNVEVYGLVMKLLGIQRWAAHTNGTSGFWDKYF
ncbi:Phosphodiest-domain-containing protein [Dentipellis sp. KUC8613]|nr:Phosphodiest-domain-containing protein [Dentipellis sp. KUC8613]